MAVTPWDGVLWAATLVAAAALVVGVVERLRPDARHVRWERWLLAVAAGLVTVAFLRLLAAFVAADVSLQYVFLYTHADLPLRWRVAGTWAGREGSLLLWAMDLAIVAALVAWRHGRQAAAGRVAVAAQPAAAPARGMPPADPALARGQAWTRLVLSAFVLAFLAAAAAQGTFAKTPDFFLAGRPDGNGLNPTLKSAFILIHPPLMFVAYALSTVPAAAVLAHLATGTDRWGRIGLVWSRVDWLVYTAAMGLGGLWAYYTLGFGGYWAWDPVEVANLLPWLALTVYLHAQLHHARYGAYRVIGPFLGLLPFLLTLFSTISTRSGLWVSVHAFTDPTNTFEPDAPMRFLDILAVEPGLLVYVRLFLATLAVGLGLWCLRLAKEHRTMRRSSLAVAAVLVAFAVLAALVPRTALALLFEVAWQATGGRAGLGLLGLLFLACVAAALPALVAKDDPAQRRALRLDLRTLAAFSVLVLALSLLVLFLAHMAAVNGWDTAFYEARLPWLATPALLGIFVLQAHSIVGRRNSLLLAAVVLAVAVAAALLSDERAGMYLLVLSAALLGVSLDRVRRAALAPGVDKRERLGPTLLFAAALLDLAFWLSPPAILDMPLLDDLQPRWPVQVVLGAVSAYVLWCSLRILAGSPPPVKGHAYLVGGLLAGFVVAAPLALLGYAMSRRHPARTRRLDAATWARLRQAGLYGAHLAVAVALLAYATSTYWKETQELALESSQWDRDGAGPGSTVTIGPYEDLRLVAVELTCATAPGSPTCTSPLATGVRAHLQDDGTADEEGRATMVIPLVLEWEPQVGAYFPQPATHRTWRGDVYVNLLSVHVAESGCSDARTVQAYQANNPPQLCTTDGIDRVEIEAIWLPGVGLMWTALALFVLSMALVIVADRGPPGKESVLKPEGPPIAD